jgi:RNA polymerase sigma-70 factor (ECF subfamily)
VSETNPTADIIIRIRAGDSVAAYELVRKYEPVIRSRIRIWLRMQDARLRRVFDSMDVCQSVMASFFVRAAAGQYDLDRPEQLIGLLVQMARHKLAHKVNKLTAQRRDIRRTSGLEEAPRSLAPGPDVVYAGRELLEAVRRRLSEDERRIADRRGQGDDWAAIAAEVGGTPDGVRMKLGRALDRVTEQLGLDELNTSAV